MSGGGGEGGVEAIKSQTSVQATVTVPETPATVNLTVKKEASADVTVVATSVDKIEPESVQLTAVATTAGQPAATTNQPTVTGQSTASNPSTVPNQPATQQLQEESSYRTIFYFPGMGRVIGSALSEGVYVDEKNRRNAIDPEEAERYIKIGERGKEEGELVKTARSQAGNLSSDFRQLQSLLGSLPTFTDTVEGRSLARGLDEPIHGEIYFRSERPELYQQQLAAQRTRQAYIIEPSSQPIYPQQQHQQFNGHLIDVPWQYRNNF